MYSVTRFFKRLTYDSNTPALHQHRFYNTPTNAKCHLNDSYNIDNYDVITAQQG